jgi:hypothetical protein
VKRSLLGLGVAAHRQRQLHPHQRAAEQRRSQQHVEPGDDVAVLVVLRAHRHQHAAQQFDLFVLERAQLHQAVVLAALERANFFDAEL